MLVIFAPVIHQGYLDLFNRIGGAIGIIGSDVIAKHTSLTRDCRTINPGAMKRIIEGLGIFSSVRVFNTFDLADLAASVTPIVMVDDDVSRKIVDEYSFKNVQFESVFLRWDKIITLRENDVMPHRIISRGEFEKEMIKVAIDEAQKSDDWWRQVGTVIVKEGKIITSGYNHHLPSDKHLSLFGDPRSNFDAGERIDLSTAIHSEAWSIAHSAKEGISLNGAAAFVTTFPCPNCAKLLAEAGIKTVYYSKGYSLLDAESILNAYNVAIVLVKFD